MLIDFKAWRIGHPNFEIKFIDILFASNVITTAIIGQDYLYIA